MNISDISNYKNVNDIPLFLLGILIVDIFVLFFVRYIGIGGISLNKWYDKYGLLAVIADVFIILIGFMIAQYIYTILIKPKYGWNIIIFLILLVFIQFIHDILLYLLVILPFPKGHNGIIDIYKEYANENSYKIIIGDACLMLGSAFVILCLKTLPKHIIAAIAVITIYIMPYILTTPIQYKKDLKKLPNYSYMK
jgi:hypothetical protein